VCEPYKDLKIDTVVMGCTHYGLLANEIRQVMGNVNIITSGEATYYVVKDRLKKRNLLNNSQKHGEIKLLTTGSVEVFKKSIGWFKNRIDALEHVSLE
jgi:glutamate racemase